MATRLIPASSHW